MFDSKNEPHEFVADSKSEAIAKACQFFDATEADLKIKGFGAGDVYGIGGRTVIIAERTDRVPTSGGDDRGPRDRDRGDRDRGGRDRGGRDRGDRGARDRGDRGGRDRGRGRDDRGPRASGRNDRDRDRDRDRGGRDREPRAASGNDGNRDRDRGNRNPGGGEQLDSAGDVDGNAAPMPSVGTAKGKLSEVGDFVLGVIQRMGLGPFTIAETDESEVLIFDIRGPAAQDLVDGNGRVVDALQLLANQCAMQTFEDPPRVVIDMEGESSSRESFLSNLAQRVARRARETGRPQRLDPMNANDRRLIHVALRDEEGIATMSHGEGRYRQVVVVPEGADEYDEARRSSH